MMMMLENTLVFGCFDVLCSHIFYFDVSDGGNTRSPIPKRKTVDYMIEYPASIYFSDCIVGDNLH
jgi:hypothetical protein